MRMDNHLTKNMRIIRLPEVINMTGFSRTTIYALLKDQKFPKQVKLSPRSVGWVECEVLDWNHQRLSERDRSNHADLERIN